MKNYRVEKSVVLRLYHIGAKFGNHFTLGPIVKMHPVGTFNSSMTPKLYGALESRLIGEQLHDIEATTRKKPERKVRSQKD